MTLAGAGTSVWYEKAREGGLLTRILSIWKQYHSRWTGKVFSRCGGAHAPRDRTRDLLSTMYSQTAAGSCAFRSAHTRYLLIHDLMALHLQGKLECCCLSDTSLIPHFFGKDLRCWNYSYRDSGTRLRW
eukprot:4283928-Amphidinium_carterae.1